MQKYLWQCAVLLSIRNEEGDITDTKLLWSGNVLAATDSSAKLIAFNAISDEDKQRADDLEVLVRPF